MSFLQPSTATSCILTIHKNLIIIKFHQVKDLLLVSCHPSIQCLEFRKHDVLIITILLASMKIYNWWSIILLQLIKLILILPIAISLTYGSMIKICNTIKLEYIPMSHSARLTQGYFAWRQFYKSGFNKLKGSSVGSCWFSLL